MWKIKTAFGATNMAMSHFDDCGKLTRSGG
jgi:hypothetical protein